MTVLSETGVLLEQLKQVLREDSEEDRRLLKAIDSKLVEVKPLMDEFNNARKEHLTHRLWLMYLELMEITCSSYMQKEM